MTGKVDEMDEWSSEVPQNSTRRNNAEVLMRCHLSDPKATIASVGALYGVLILHPDTDGWSDIHRAIADRLWPGEERVAALRKLDKVKEHGRRLANAYASRFTGKQE